METFKNDLRILRDAFDVLACWYCVVVGVGVVVAVVGLLIFDIIK